MTAFKNKVLWRGTQKADPAIADLQAIEDIVVEIKANADCSAGTNELTFTTPDTGKLHVIERVIARALTGTPADIFIDYHDGSTYYYLYWITAPGNKGLVTLPGPITLKPGHTIKVVFSSMILHDSIQAWIKGYQVDQY